jgi:hypothetical protein
MRPRRRRLAFVAIPLLLAIGIWVATRTETPREEGDIRLPEIGASAVPAGRRDELPLVRERAEARPSNPAAPTSRDSPPDAAVPTASVAPPDPEAMIEVDKVSLMIRDYRTMAGENPVGTNAEIMSALVGKNPKEAKLGPPEGMQLNENGELIDRWGTPYFFHQLSRDHMEIRSAGADKTMWTDDDPVVR